MNHWVKVEDRLPEIPQGRRSIQVIAYGTILDPSCLIDREVSEARYRNEGFEYGEYDRPLLVSHWMPMPEAPKE